MDERVVHADRKYRRVILIAFGVSVCIGVVLLQWVLPWATRYLAQRRPQEALQILQVAVSLMFLSALPIAWYIWSLGRKGVTSQQMPPPGVRVIKDTIIIRGRSAVARGKALMVIAVLLAIVSLIGGIWLPWKLGKIMPATDAGGPSSQISGWDRDA
ncbi:MAG: hypothetical protein ACYTAS_14635 [Planctomycetota bacterium]|jgi:hypothetical protein